MSDAFDGQSSVHRMLLGAAAGLAGTILMQQIMNARFKALPNTIPPFQGNPSEYFLGKMESMLPAPVKEHLPQLVHKASAAGMGLGYGASFGAIYGLLRGKRPTFTQTLLEGTLLGIVSWMAGYLGWLPATGLMPPVWKHSPAQAALPPVEHAVYGAVTAAAYDLMREYV